MEWHRVSKSIRRHNWYAVKPPSYDDISEAFEWCKKHNSTGRFYNHYTNTRWWFEREEDALLFVLTWVK